MKYRLLIIIYFITFVHTLSQNKKEAQLLSEFNLTNSSSPAFVLIEEAPSEIYIPENLKALTVHALNNFDGSLSIELSPYYFINTKSKDRSFFKYIGIEKKFTPIKKRMSFWLSPANDTNSKKVEMGAEK